MQPIAKEISYKQPHSLLFLDGLRGIAALYVMIGHARWFLWEGGDVFNANPGAYSLLEKSQVYFFSLFKYGHQMVLFFFVLSGFVIHLKQAKALSEGNTASLKGYFFRRARRIIPPVIFALVLTYVCDKVVEYMGASIYLRTTPVQTLNNAISFDHSLPTLLGNIFFVQDTYVPVFGSNGPLWSLKYEWWFYMLYPIFLLINKRSAAGTLLVVAVLSILSVIGWSWGIKLLDDVLAYLFCWWLGCFSADIYMQRAKLPQWVSVAACICLLAIPMQSKMFANSNILRDTVVAIGFWGLLNTLLILYKKGARIKVLEKLKFLGDCSYTLYVIHVPLLVLFNALILFNTGNIMPRSMFFVWLSIPVMIFLAYIIHLYIEKPFIRPSQKSATAVKASF